VYKSVNFSHTSLVTIAVVWLSCVWCFTFNCCNLLSRCLSENGWDYTKAAQIFMELNVSVLSERCSLLCISWYYQSLPRLFFSVLTILPLFTIVIHLCTYTRLTALCPRLPGWCTKKVKPIWILLKPETVSGGGISWAICKSAPSSRQMTTPAPHHSVFYRSDALPAAEPTASKHWRHNNCYTPVCL